jgi:proline iminopeptidase
MTPDEFTNQEIMLDVGDGHTIYVYDWGLKTAKTPIIHFHGGPGSSIKDGMKAGFNPQKQRVIFYDQRGCGKSLPYGSLENNTMPDLVSDVQKILKHLQITDVVFYGRSWGVAVALAAAIAHPTHVKALILGSIFTASQWEIDWIDKGHFATHYPEAWEKYVEDTPAEHRSNPSAYHYKNVLQGDAHQIFNSALALQQVEYSIMSLDDRPKPTDPETFDPTSARLFAHYLSQGAFMPDEHILKNAHKLTMPVWLVHGRYDMDCPPITAHKLSKVLPNCQGLTWTISNHRIEHEGEAVMRVIAQQFEEK